MKKLSQTQQTEKSQHAAAVHEKEEALELAIAAFNQTLEEIREPVEQALADLNEAITAAEEWRAEINSDQEMSFDDHSEKWQESENGQYYSSWKDEWSPEFSEVEMELPEPLEVPELPVAEALENLPDDPDRSEGGQS